MDFTHKHRLKTTHAHFDTSWNTKKGKNTASIGLEINTNFLIPPKPKESLFRRISSKVLCCVILLYLVSINFYIYILHVKLFTQKSDLSNVIVTVDRLVNTNDHTLFQLDNLGQTVAKSVHTIDQWKNNLRFPLVVERLLPSALGRRPKFLSPTFALLNEISSTNIANNDVIGRNQSYVEQREKRGVKKSDNKRRCRQNGRQKNKDNQKETVAVHFLGSYRQILFSGQGPLGPWYCPTYSSEELSSVGFNMVDNDKMVEIKKKAVYFIYAQVHYFSKDRANSFSINVISIRAGRDSEVAVCSKDNARPYEAEVSCQTSLAYSLDVNDRIYIRQREKDRKIMYHEGYTFFGLLPIAPYPAQT